MPLYDMKTNLNNDVILKKTKITLSLKNVVVFHIFVRFHIILSSSMSAAIGLCLWMLIQNTIQEKSSLELSYVVRPRWFAYNLILEVFKMK